MNTLLFANFFLNQPKEGAPHDYEKLYQEALVVLRKAEKMFEEVSNKNTELVRDMARARMSEEGAIESAKHLLSEAGKYRMIQKIVTGETYAIDLAIRQKEIEVNHGKVEEERKEG